MKVGGGGLSAGLIKAVAVGVDCVDCDMCIQRYVGCALINATLVDSIFTINVQIYLYGIICVHIHKFQLDPLR